MALSTACFCAQMDCSPLDPRASVTTEKEGEIKASVNTLYKIARVGGSVKGKMREEIQNLQKGTPVTEQGLIARETLYLFCGMVANAKDISTERKFELFREMMEELNTGGKSKSKPPRKNSTKESNKVLSSSEGAEKQIKANSQSDKSPDIHQNTAGNQSPNVYVAPYGSAVVQYGEPSEKSEKGKAEVEVQFLPQSFIIGKVLPKLEKDGSSAPVKVYINLSNSGTKRATGALVYLTFRPGISPRVLEGAWRRSDVVPGYAVFIFEDPQLPLYATFTRVIGKFEIKLPRESDTEELLASFFTQGDFGWSGGLIFYNRTRDEYHSWSPSNVKEATNKWNEHTAQWNAENGIK
jgi:hypothetical protein